MTEIWITRVGTKNGKRTAERMELGVPLAVARGHWDKLSDRAIHDLIEDLTTEQLRRFNR